MARSSFKFRMKRLLDVRVMREKLAQSELLSLRRRAQAEHDKLAVMQHEEQELRTAQGRPLERGEDLYEWAAKRLWLENSIKEKVAEQVTQQGAITRAEQAVVTQQEVVKQRGIDVKALEKVQENQREVHRVEQLREEGLFLDDLAGQGFLRRRTMDERIAAEDTARRDNEGAPS